MKYIKNWSSGAYGILAIIEIALYGWSLFSLLPPFPSSEYFRERWLSAAIAFTISKALGRRRGAESWVSVAWQSGIFAAFAYLLLG
jgi:hypothetical protein